MAIDPALKMRLDQAGPDDIIDVVFILSAEAVTSQIAPVDPANIAGGREAFAREARKAIEAIIAEACGQSARSTVDVQILENMASARFRAPADLVRRVAAHPSVAATRLAEAS